MHLYGGEVRRFWTKASWQVASSIEFAFTQSMLSAPFKNKEKDLRGVG
ncbi:hypothetical protein VCRA2120O59_260035 [Vibrio crassostreae]|nr:hypothetical protein VCRA2120O59_260035 [Vibrio crassostreae]CAK3469718.1 hypothetical protein VCRA2120O58_230011 [Vibrio crassostreae]